MQIHFFKKALIVVLMLSLFETSLFAQSYSNKPSSIFSFTLGLTSTNLIKDAAGYKSGILFNGGFVYSLTLNNHLNVAMEALYTGKAFKMDSPLIKYRYYYMDVPLYVQWKLGDNVRINAGGYYSIATNSQQIVLDSNKPNGVRINKVGAVKPTDYGFLLGVEFDINKSIGLGARYSLSGSTFFEKNAVNFGVFQFSVKYSPIKTYKVFFGKD